MRTTTTIITFLLLTCALFAQQDPIDMRSCEAGRWHDAKPCMGCGTYKGRALLCSGSKADASLGYLEIRVPQGFTRLEKVKVKLKIRPLEDKAPKVKVTGVDRISLGELSTQFGISAQAADKAPVAGTYYVEYTIKGVVGELQ